MIVNIAPLSLFKNSTWSLIDVAIVSLIGFLSNVALARIVGPVNLGLYSYVVNIASLVVAVASAGLSTFLLREAVKKPWKTARYVNAALSIFLFYSIPIVVISTTILSIFTSGPAPLEMFLSTLFQIEMMFFGFFIMLFISIGRSDISSILNITFKAIFGLALVWLLIWYKSMVQVSHILLISCVILVVLISICGRLYSRLLNIQFSFRPKFKLYRVYVLSSYPILGAALAEFINLKIDTLMLGNIRGYSELGFYTASYTVYMGFTLIALALTKVFSPVFIRLLKNNKSKARSFLLKYLWLNLIYSGVVMCFLLVFSENVIQILYGDDYELSANILMYLACALPFINLNRLVNYSIIGAGGQASYFYYTVIGSMINVCINVWLIPIYGALGAVVATIVTEAIVLVFGLRFLIRFFNERSRKWS
jgi:O-antigen/teichoic acid export membrane protein